jgi:hypothetical protein
MTFSTKDRPVDSPRYITFQGVGGDPVMMIYPDLYQVEVYEQTGGILKLKSVAGIQLAIETYLK